MLEQQFQCKKIQEAEEYIIDQNIENPDILYTALAARALKRRLLLVIQHEDLSINPYIHTQPSVNIDPTQIPNINASFTIPICYTLFT